MTDFMRIHPEDTVAVAISRVESGRTIRVGDEELQVKQEIPAGHKIALRDIAEGEAIIKYGQSTGCACRAIARGEWVHTHNVRTGLSGMLEYSYQPNLPDVAGLPEPPVQARSFLGYRRSDGSAGIRNELWIIPAVGCVNRVCENLVRLFGKEEEAKLVEGTYTFPHPYGCSQMGGDHQLTRAFLAGLVRHPNAGGVLVVHLGCENNQYEQFREVIGEFDPQRVQFITVQEVDDEYQAGVSLLKELARYAGSVRRKDIPLSELKIGLKCGGSDGFSGITANPLLGRISDMLVHAGGSSVLTEVPEMFGAEHLLMERCQTEEVFEKCVKMVNGFKEYYLRYGQTIYENPSPGNKAGGITTLEDKSLGCIQKGGFAPVTDVLEMGDRLCRNGLNLLSGPGNDIVAVSNLASAGVHVVLFTTGRGTPLGAPVPTIKVATNSELARRKAHWIDFDAGRLLSGETMEEVADDFFLYLLDVASGRAVTRSEEYGFREIAIFKDGVTL